MNGPQRGSGRPDLGYGRTPARTTLILVGRAGSGKSTIGPILAKETGLPLLEIGELVRRQAAQHGRNPLEHANETFARGQHSKFVALAVSEAKRLGLPCIISGPRRPDELLYLQTMLNPTVAIGLSLSEAERDSRLDKRKNEFELQAYRDRRDAIEEAWGIGQTIESCDYQVLSYGQPDAVAEHCLKLWLMVDQKLDENET